MTAIPTPISVSSPLVAGERAHPAGEALGPAATPVLSALLAWFTFGLVPAVIWPWRWARLLDDERAFYRDLTGWWRRRVAPADGVQLDGVLAALRPRPILIALPRLAVLFVTAMIAVGVLATTDGLQHVVAATYRFDHHWTRAGWRPARFDSYLHTSWVWGLSFAYACHWYAVRSHERAVGDLVRWTNRLARTNGYRRVANDASRLGLGPLWVALGIGFCWFHAWWAIPMMLAGAAQRRYADVATPRLQLALAAQAGDAAAFAGPGGTAARFCPTPHCGNRLPSAARFCPRCGSATVTTTPHA